MKTDTTLAAALKNAVQGMSKKKQTEMIANYIYKKYQVFSRFKPLAIGIENDLIADMPQFDPKLIVRVLSNHCRRPRYIKALAKGGKRFNLNNRFQGEISPEEQQNAAQHPFLAETINKSLSEEMNTNPVHTSTINEIDKPIVSETSAQLNE